MRWVRVHTNARYYPLSLRPLPVRGSGLYFHSFKMALLPSSARAKDLSTIQIGAAGRTDIRRIDAVSGGRGMTTPDPRISGQQPLSLLVQRVLEYVKADALDYIGKHHSLEDAAKVRFAPYL